MCIRIKMIIPALSLICTSAVGQQRVGINTTTPDRTLEIRGVGTQHLRIHSTSFFGNEAGIELIRGDAGSNARDWKVTNDAGLFKIATSTNNFAGAGQEWLRILDNGNIGINTTAPQARLHVRAAANEKALLLGQTNSANLSLGDIGIEARNNGNSAALYIQAAGGNTSILPNGNGQVSLGQGGGHVGIGTPFSLGRLNVNAGDFQVYLRNDNGVVNDWYIGTSDASWLIGDNQLVFSPTGSSADSRFRLMDVTDNTGDVAPVIIQSAGNQALLLDGNEIESKYGALYINHNSDHNTYVNPSGGSVGIGTANPLSLLHINTNAFGLGLQNADKLWTISPLTDGDLYFGNGALFVSAVDFATGNWIAMSDRRLKENIEPLSRVMQKLMSLPTYTYNYIHSTSTHRDIGVIAQDLEPLFPEVVSKTDGQYGVAYDLLAVLAIKGVQEQQVQLEALNNHLDALLEKQ